MASHIQSLACFDHPLRIHRRGNFFSDEGFVDFRSHFENAARDLLQEFDLHRNEDSFKSYRRLRDRQMSGTDRTAKIAEESDKYKIVLDVEGFSDADLQVKVSGPNEIVVEGLQETTDGGGTFSKRSFRRRFSLPGLALVQDATSVLSSDNVLTVNIPKKIQEITNESELSSSTVQQSSQAKNINTSQESTNTFSSAVSDTLKKSSLMDDAFNTSTLMDDKLWDLQIVPRKSFFDDSFFENVRSNFQKTVDEMMENRIRRIDSVGDVGIFKKIRETKEENVQAISVTEDAREHKIVLDVHGYSEKDLKVRAVSESELLVEGSVEKKTEYTSCTHTFKRKFVLPSAVNIREATSALSSEGILTIIVPKRLEAIDYPIPVRSEASSHIQNIIKQTQAKELSTFSNTKREHIVPVVQDEITSNTKQCEQQYSLKSNATTTSTAATSPSSYGISDSQNLLHKLERTVQMCEDIDNRQQPHVPFNLEGSHISKIRDERKDTTNIASETSEIIKESQRLVNESAKLIKDIGQQTSGDHYVPVQLDAGISVNTSSSTTQAPNISNQQSNITKHVTTTDTRSSRIIPISLKGSFYNESVFDDARKTIEDEVRDIFTKYRQSSVGEESQKKTELQRSTQDTTQLAKNSQATSTILDDAHNYKIVVDIFGFEETELRVRITGLNELTVEGNSEKSKEGSISKHSFQRSFQLPDNVDLERTSTALSEEGILTITVPKKNQLLLVSKKSVPFLTQIEKDISAREVKPTLVVDSSGIVQDKKIESSRVHEINTKREYIVPLSLEESADISEAGSVQSTASLSSQTSTTSNTSKDVSQNILSTSTSCSSVDTQIQGASNVQSDKVIQIEGIHAGNVDNRSTNEQTKEIVTKTLFDLPIVPRGYFFDDNIFQDSRSMFESILRNKMLRFNRSTSFVDDLGFFKSLRDNRIYGGNQMATLSEDEHFNKIVLDVQGFDESNLKIRVLSENEIVIEGNTEEKTGNSISRKTFKKHFVLPGAVDLRRANSALSSDGVLNIKIPKKI